MEIHYGSEQTDLSAPDGKWTIGGGGGNLILDSRLANAELVLGNKWGKGVVTLTDRGNSISKISFIGGVTLEYTSLVAWGASKIDLTYTNRLRGADGIEGSLNEAASGVLPVDGMASVNLSTRQGAAIGLKSDGAFNGDITVGRVPPTASAGLPAR